MLVFLALARKRSGPVRGYARGVDIEITTVADGIAFLRGDVSPLER